MQTSIRDHILEVMQKDEWLTGYEIRNRVVKHILDTGRSTTFINWLNQYVPKLSGWWLKHFSELSCSLYKPLNRMQNDGMVEKRWVGDDRKHVEFTITDIGLAVRGPLSKTVNDALHARTGGEPQIS